MATKSVPTEMSLLPKIWSIDNALVVFFKFRKVRNGVRKSKASVLFYIVALCTLVLCGCVPSGTEDVAEEPVKNSVQASEGPVTNMKHKSFLPSGTGIKFMESFIFRKTLGNKCLLLFIPTVLADLTSMGFNMPKQWRQEAMRYIVLIFAEEVPAAEAMALNMRCPFLRNSRIWSL